MGESFILRAGARMAVVVLSAVLASCGGGGGGSVSTPPPPQVSAAPSGMAVNYPEVTPASTLASDPGVASPVAPLLASSVDSATVFIAGVNGIAVQPVTPE